MVGHDDSAIGADVTPAPTTVRLELEMMGEQAMRLVAGDVGSAVGAQPSEVVVEGGRRIVHSATRLAVRASAGPAAR